MAVKGKEIVGKSSSGKRKSVSKSEDRGEKSTSRKKTRSNASKFVDDEAVDADSDGEDEYESENDNDRDFVDDIEAEMKGKNGSGKARPLPFLLKEEELSDEELENMLKQRYRRDSEYVAYADENKDVKESDDNKYFMHSMKDPTVWKIKCMVGRERYTVFCLIQKFVDLQSLGTKLQIVSAFALEHIKGYIYIEADREFDVAEACKGVCTIYSSKMSLVPKNEVPHLLSVQNKVSEISEGTWVRMKLGAYKGDLAQVVAVDATRKRATIKLIPRINLQAIAQKLGGVPLKQVAVPAPRLIRSHELEEFRARIQYRRDRQTGETFEVIDGLMLKNGFLYKKVAIGSISCWGVEPSLDEIQKFKVVDNASEDSDWLSAIYGGRRKSHSGLADKGMDEMLEGTSGTKEGTHFQLHDLVLFGGKDFGMIIGMESDIVQILKGDSEREDTVTVNIWEIKSACDDKKFRVPDMHNNIMAIGDTVKVLEGPFKDRQGIIKHIYRGSVFLHSSNQTENGSFFCVKSESCQNIKNSKDASDEMDDGMGPPGFEDLTMPADPQSPKRPHHQRESSRSFNSNNQGDGGRTFSIGQTLRIRVGPLKGHLCRVVAVYRSDVTVKLDSQLKVITVNSEHLSEAAMRNYGNSKDSWNDSSASGFLGKSADANPFSSFFNNDDHQMGDPWGSAAVVGGNLANTDSWDKAVPSNGDQNASWNKATDTGGAFDAVKEQASSWEKDALGWDKAASKTNDGGSCSDWGKKSEVPSGDHTGSWSDAGGWGKANLESGNQADQAGGWNDAGGWGKVKIESRNQDDPSTVQMGGWDNIKGAHNDQAGSWKKSENNWDKGKQVIQDNAISWDSEKGGLGKEADSWGKALESKGKDNFAKTNQDDPWSKSAGSWKAIEASGSQDGCWNNATAGNGDHERGWSNTAEGQTRTELGRSGQASCWSNTKGESGDQFEKWGKSKDTSEGEGGQTDGWSKQKNFGGDQRPSWNRGGGQSKNWGTSEKTGEGDSRGWNKTRFDHSGQTGGWSKSTNFGSDRASSWTRDGGQSDSWDKSKDAGEGESTTGWSKEGSATQGQSDGWNKLKDFSGSQTSGWNSGGQSERWGNSKDMGGEGKGWNKTGFGGKGQKDGWSKPMSFDGDQVASWHKDGSRRKDETENWNRQKDFDGGQGSGWNRGTGNNEEGGNNGGRGFGGRRRGGGRRGRGGRDYSDRGRPFDRGQPSSWNSGNPSSWNMPNKSGWNQGSATNDDTGASGTQSDNWNSGSTFVGDKLSRWKKGIDSEDKGRDQSNNWNDHKYSGEDDSSNWNRKSFANKTNEDDNWNSRKSASSDCKHGSGADEHRDGGGELSFDSWNKPKDSDHGQSSGWDGGSFSNRSGHRDPVGSWNKGKDSGGDRSSSWNKGATASEGAGRSTGQASSLSRGESASEGQWSSWSKESVSATKEHGISGQAGGWGKGPSTKEIGVTNQADNGNKTEDSGGGNQRSGWNKTNAFGGGDSSKTEASDGDGPLGWKKIDSSRSGGSSGWSNGTAANKDADESGNQGDARIKANNSDGNQGSGWNEGKSLTKEADTVAGQVDGWNQETVLEKEDRSNMDQLGGYAKTVASWDIGGSSGSDVKGGW